MTPDLAPACPRCSKSDRVDRIDPPAHDPEAIFYCGRDGLTFTGKPNEAYELKARDAARAAERGDLDRRGVAGRQAGVLPVRDEP